MSFLMIIIGVYYVATGLWPALHMRSFEKLTGPKVDKWLARMVGLLTLSSGLVFLFSGLTSEVVPLPIVLLAALNMISFLLINLWYVLRKVIAPIYLGDALIQAVLLLTLTYLSSMK